MGLPATNFTRIDSLAAANLPHGGIQGQYGPQKRGAIAQPSHHFPTLLSEFDYRLRQCIRVFLDLTGLDSSHSETRNESAPACT